MRPRCRRRWLPPADWCGGQIGTRCIYDHVGGSVQGNSAVSFWFCLSVWVEIETSPPVYLRELRDVISTDHILTMGKLRHL